MTREWLKVYLPVMSAFAEGKEVQYWDGDGWRDTPNPDWSWREYRIKPEPKPKYRAWAPRDVPVGAAVRNFGRDRGDSWPVWIIAAILEHGVSLGHAFEPTYGRLLESYQYSTDHGATWKPCGVLVEEGAE